MTSSQNKPIIIFEIEEESRNDSYYQKNKDYIKQRYIENIDKRRSYQKYYNSINNESYLEYQKSYYEKRKEKLLESKKEKVECECGKMVSAGHLTCHKKSVIHKKRLNQCNASIICK